MCNELIDTKRCGLVQSTSPRSRFVKEKELLKRHHLSLLIHESKKQNTLSLEGRGIVAKNPTANNFSNHSKTNNKALSTFAE